MFVSSPFKYFSTVWTSLSPRPDRQTTESTEEAQEEKDPLIPEIDTSVELQAGSRVAVVSKSTSGEFWGLVKKGMEQAIADVNEAYCFKKEDQVTMTFEGASVSTVRWR